MSATNQQVLDAIEGLREEDLVQIKEKLDKMNGRLRGSEQVQAALVQWRRDHETVDAERTEEIKGELKTLRGRTNIAGTILAITQAATALGAFLFGQKGP